MGKALEFLGPNRCCEILASLVEVDDKKGSTYNQWFVCPFHGDTDASAHYEAEIDSFFCFGCQTTGDLINFYTELNGFDDVEGFRAFLKEFCPEHLDGSHSAPKTRIAPKAVRHEWVPDAAYLPPEKWRLKADKIVRECAEELQKRPEVLAQLADWGIDAQTAKTCLIGWNAKDRYSPVTAMDLPYQPSKNNPKAEMKIWWPVGLVFASMRDGLPAKVKIRVETLPAWMPADLRYFQIVAGKIPHGYRAPYLIAGRPDFKIWVIVETDRDAYLIWSACRGLPIGVMAVGSAGSRPDAYAANILKNAELILCALDNDAAGRKFAQSFWKDEFPLARRWPVPTRCGKDAGDAVRPLRLMRGKFELDEFYNMSLDSFYVDIRQWIKAGIPARVWRAVREHKKTVQPPPEQPTPAKPKSRMDQALEEIKKYPEYYEHFISFLDLIRGKPIGFFRNEQGGIYVDTTSHSWEGKNWELMQKVWKEFIGLEDIIEYYFPDKIRSK